MLSRTDLYVLCQIPDLWYWLCTFIFGLFALYFLRKCYISIIKMRHIDDTGISRIRSAAQGQVKLQGRTIPSPLQGLFNSPLTHTPCCWYQYQIEYYNNSSKTYVPIEVGQSPDLICFTDETGICYIDPKGADISTQSTEMWRGNRRKPKRRPTGFWAHFAAATGRYRYIEKRINPDTPIWVSGYFITFNPDELSSEQASVAAKRVYQAWQQHVHPILQFLPKAPAKNTESQTPETASSLHLVSQYGLDKREPFLLSAYDARKLKRHYLLDILVWAISFIGVGSLTLFLIHFRINC